MHENYRQSFNPWIIFCHFAWVKVADFFIRGSGKFVSGLALSSLTFSSMRGQYYYDLTNQRPVFSRSRLLRAISAEDVSTKQSQQRGEAGVGRPGTSSEEAVIISGLAFSKRWLDLILFDKKIQYTMWIMKRLLEDGAVAWIGRSNWLVRSKL